MSEPKKIKMDVTAFFGDAEYDFMLHNAGWELLKELERKFDCGCFVIFRSIYSGNYLAEHIREVLRLGLIGGGKTPTDANALVKLYFDREPLAAHAGLAIEVLGAALFGVGNVPDEAA